MCMFSMLEINTKIFVVLLLVKECIGKFKVGDLTNFQRVYDRDQRAPTLCVKHKHQVIV